MNRSKIYNDLVLVEIKVSLLISIVEVRSFSEAKIA